MSKKSDKNKVNFNVKTNKNLYRKEHKNVLKKTHLLYNIFKLNLALKRANYNYNNITIFDKKKEKKNPLFFSLNTQAIMKEKREKFLLNYIIKRLQKNTLKKKLKAISKKSFRDKKTKKKHKLYLLDMLNKNKKLMLPKRASAKYKFLIQKAIIKIKLKLKVINKNLAQIKNKMYALRKHIKNNRKYKMNSKLLTKKVKLLKQKDLLTNYIKLKVNNIILPKKRYSINNKQRKNNIKISYEPSLSGKSKIKIILRINNFLKRKSKLINKLNKIKNELSNNYDYLISNTVKDKKINKITQNEQRFCYK